MLPVPKYKRGAYVYPLSNINFSPLVTFWLLYSWSLNNETLPVSFILNMFWTSCQWVLRWFNSVKLPSISTKYFNTALLRFGKNLFATISENNPNLIEFLSITAVLPYDVSPSV